MPVERSAGGIVFFEKRGEILYLILHYGAGHWDFPKGHIEKGETPQKTALREIEEETGLNEVDLLEGFKESIKYFFKKEGKTVYKIVVFFLVRSQCQKVRLSFEHKGFKWLPFEKALKQLTFENSKNLLKKAHSFLTKK